MNHDKRISRARAGLIISAPFYATLAMGLEVIERDDIETMATDGDSLFYNPSFVDELSDPELRGVVAHEVMHVANLHHTRRNGRDADQWNIACDYVINETLISEGFTLPDGALIDARFNGMSADQVFSALGKDKKDQQGDAPKEGQGDDKGQGQGAPDPARTGGIMDAAPSHDKAALQAAEMDTKAKVLQAVQAANKAGEASEAMQKLAADIKTPLVDWRAVLRRYIDLSARKDYSWSRPNRRHVASGLYLPSQVPDGLERLTVIIDTSGSIDRAALSTFLAELQAAVDDAQPDVVEVIQCDTRITARQEFVAGDPIAFDLAGGGGTNMQPALDAITDTSACIMFTDCKFPRPLVAPHYPVLFARWGNGGKVPAFGELVDVA